jgi:DNA-binding beta-propeller fold protein YncE
MRIAAIDLYNYEYPIKVFATDEVLMRLQNIGRTEDIKFSPDCRRLAIAGFKKDKLLILDIKIVSSRNRISVSLTDFVELTSPDLNRPHGLAFIDDEILVVANRRGKVSVFKIPSGGGDKKKLQINASLTIGCNEKHKVHTPGSVSVSRFGHDRYEILICNNYANHVTQHILDSKDQLTLISSEKLLSNGLEVPDGVAVTNDNRWIAISNHDRNCVSLYENTDQLNTQSKPDGSLRDIIYPHGIRFTPDDNHVIVADAGSPYINIYARKGDGWKGTHVPQATLRVMDEAAYWRGRINPQEGGPKGIDIDSDMNVLVTTCEENVLQFSDLRRMLVQRGVPFDKRIKYFWWRYGWRYERFKRKLQNRI